MNALFSIVPVESDDPDFSDDITHIALPLSIWLGVSLACYLLLEKLLYLVGVTGLRVEMPDGIHWLRWVYADYEDPLYGGGGVVDLVELNEKFFQHPGDATTIETVIFHGSSGSAVIECYHAKEWSGVFSRPFDPFELLADAWQARRTQ